MFFSMIIYYISITHTHTHPSCLHPLIQPPLSPGSRGKVHPEGGISLHGEEKHSLRLGGGGGVVELVRGAYAFVCVCVMEGKRKTIVPDDFDVVCVCGGSLVRRILTHICLGSLL